MEKNYIIPTSLLQLITSDQAYHYNIVPDSYAEGLLRVKTNQLNEGLKRELEVIFGKKIVLVPETKSQMEIYLSTNFRKSQSKKTEHLNYSEDFLETIVWRAKEIGSSDLHFEPFETKCRVRFRIDGKLKEYFVIQRSDFLVMVNKLKINSGLDISEKRLPQDGRMTLKTEQDEFDIRVSSLPTFHGEKIVLRILSKDSNLLDLETLGFSEKERGQYLNAIKKPNGMILISGPTGSGKTTTLYATLKFLNEEKTNIVTIEDPIEYTLEGINQVQLKENIGLDFSRALRTFLRQDPDVIMLGEIRDVKTANMAIRAALTGHLVLSTIHTNSAWATLSRLTDMGVPPFLIANTLHMSIAQRLVRKLCVHCKEETDIEHSLFPENFEVPKHLKKHWVSKGCEYCYHTGFMGRKAIYEMIPIQKELIPYIKQNRIDIDDYFISQKMVSLKNNAIHLIKQGVTSIEEVYALLID